MTPPTTSIGLPSPALSIDCGDGRQFTIPDVMTFVDDADALFAAVAAAGGTYHAQLDKLREHVQQTYNVALSRWQTHALRLSAGAELEKN